jgi:hypothetical protein
VHGGSRGGICPRQRPQRLDTKQGQTLNGVASGQPGL